jgi:predicted nucleic acid-binding protein
MPAGPTVTNRSCLIALEAIGRLDLLEGLYGIIVVPTAVVNECGGIPLPPWIQVMPVQNSALVQALRMQLGAGESEAIALAVENGAERLILNDKKARRVAKQFALPLSGTLAVVLYATEQGVIPAVRPVFDDLIATGFRISDALLKVALHAAGE